ncbi:hypothetical protein HMPREF9514_01380 [Enterococcus faecalis TX0855]|nr:hypothetical protein HMPREF9514_01380 [Enterococcus faecalis TX0855]EPH77732.1 hypothetical protein D926_00744 [Enterococcus faecalis D811610-10]EPI30817.1 hypothetical protein D350_01229 [Enterococcus faecalis VC1B-1]
MTNIDHYYIELWLLNKEERFDFNKKMQNRRSNLSQTDLSSPPKIENMLLNYRQTMAPP